MTIFRKRIIRCSLLQLCFTFSHFSFIPWPNPSPRMVCFSYASCWWRVKLTRFLLILMHCLRYDAKFHRTKWIIFYLIIDLDTVCTFSIVQSITVWELAVSCVYLKSVETDAFVWINTDWTWFEIPNALIGFGYQQFIHFEF